MTSTTREQLDDIDLSTLPPAERFAYWSDVICALYAPSDNECLFGSARFDGRLCRQVFGNVEISEIDVAPILSIRDAQGVRRNPSDDIIVSYLVEGEGHLTQGGQSAVQRAGDLVMYDAVRPFTYGFDSRYHGFWVRLPRKMVEFRMDCPEQLTARTLSTTSAVVILASQMVQQTMRVGEGMDAVLRARLGTSVADIVTTAVQAGFSRESCSGTRGAIALDRVKQFIESRRERQAARPVVLPHGMMLLPASCHRRTVCW